MVFPTRQQFLESCEPQVFSLPMPTIEYLLHSSPEMYQKIIQCCKLFFLKYQIFAAQNLAYKDEYGWVYYNTNKRINLDKIMDKKIWVSGSFTVVHKKPTNFLSVFIPKIYRYDVKELFLEYQILSFNDLKFLATGVKECRILWSPGKYDNVEVVPLEDIFILFSGAKYLEMRCNYDPANATCKSYKDLVDACAGIEKISLCTLPGNINIPEFYRHLKCSKNRSLISTGSCTGGNGIDQVIDEILNTETFDFVPPVVAYFNLYYEKTKIKKMEKIQAREAAKYH